MTRCWVFQPVRVDFLEECMGVPAQTTERLRRICGRVMDGLVLRQSKSGVHWWTGLACHAASGVDGPRRPTGARRSTSRDCHAHGAGRTRGGSFIPLKCVMPVSLELRAIRMASNAVIRGPRCIDGYRVAAGRPPQRVSVKATLSPGPRCLVQPQCRD